MTTKIGLIGSGYVGQTLAGLFVDAGHEVVVSNSRGPESLADLVADLGDSGCAGTPVDAAEFGEIAFDGLSQTELVVDYLRPGSSKRSTRCTGRRCETGGDRRHRPRSDSSSFSPVTTRRRRRPSAT